MQYKQPSTEMSRCNQGSQHNATDINPLMNDHTTVTNPVEKERQANLQRLYDTEKKKRRNIV